jgi:hypothetical protein
MGFDDNQSMIYRLWSSFVISLVALAGCSPTFNWREAHWSQDATLKVLLPCSPDHGSRPMNMADQTFTLHMMGCEAGGHLFVVAMVAVSDKGHGIEVQRQWQQAMLDNMHATASQGLQKQEIFALRGASEQPPPIRIYALGKRQDGRLLGAQALWFFRGGQLYHAAVYADKLEAEVVQLFFEGLRFP